MVMDNMLRLALTSPDPSKRKISTCFSSTCFSRSPPLQETMSLGLQTLLEAAKFVELQEWKEQQRQAYVAPLVTAPPQPQPHPPKTTVISQHIIHPIQQPTAILIEQPKLVVDPVVPTIIQQEQLHQPQQVRPQLQQLQQLQQLDQQLQQQQLHQQQLLIQLQQQQQPQQAQVLLHQEPQQQPSQLSQEQQQQRSRQQLQQRQQQHQQQLQHHLIQNSFDIINPLIIDEDGEQKRKQPPLVFRSGTREVHNKLEKHRRAQLKECFDILKKQLPTQLDEKKTSNLSILHSALRYIHGLKRKEREFEHEMERLAREKIAFQQRLAALKKEVSALCDIDFSTLLPEFTSGTLPEVTKIDEDMPPIVRTPPELVPTNQPALSITTPLTNGIKEQVQTTALSVLPVGGYPVSQSIVVHKLAIVPKGITDITSPVTHFITTPTQPLNGKVLPMVNAQYVVKPVVVVSSPPSETPHHS